MEKKLVNVYTRAIIRGLKSIPIRSDARGIRLDPEDIKTCIMSKARVEEILDNGKILPLDFTNYNTDNNAAIYDNVKKQDEEEKKAAEAKAKEEAKKAEEERKAAEEKKKAEEKELAKAIAEEEAEKAEATDSKDEKEKKNRRG